MGLLRVEARSPDFLGRLTGSLAGPRVPVPAHLWPVMCTAPMAEWPGWGLWQHCPPRPRVPQALGRVGAEIPGQQGGSSSSAGGPAGGSTHMRTGHTPDGWTPTPGPLCTSGALGEWPRGGQVQSWPLPLPSRLGLQGWGFPCPEPGGRKGISTLPCHPVGAGQTPARAFRLAAWIERAVFHRRLTPQMPQWPGLGCPPLLS